MTLDKAIRERVVLERAIYDLLQTFQKRTGLTVQGISYVDTYVSATEAPMRSAQMYIGRQVSVDVRL